jgi:DNA-binding response OmpR family regulator
MRILLVEDDQKAARVLARGLREEGFVVAVVHSGEEGEEKATVERYDVIVLDWLLPGRSGLEVCRRLRTAGMAYPILMLTARDDVADRVAGLNAGADDYLAKPFVFAELLARIHALRRRSIAGRPTLLTVADLTVDPVRHRVSRAGVVIGLTPKEYSILERLVEHAGEVVTRSRLIESVWADDPDLTDNALDVHVSHLRHKIDGEAAVPLIHTVRGRGYRVGVQG